MSAPRVRLLLLLAALAAGIHLRLRGLGELPLFGDEHHTLTAVEAGYGTLLTTFDAYGSHVALPLLQRLSLDLFGPGLWSFRLVGLVPGILTLLLAYPLLRDGVGPSAATLATWLLALSPIHVYYTRFARGYALVVLLALVLGWLLRRLLAGKGSRAAWAGLVLVAALLPWVHLSSVGLVVGLGCAGLGCALRVSRALALRLAGALALAATLTFLLLLPVLAQVRDYARGLSEEDASLLTLGVPTLLAGGRSAGLAGLALLGLSCFCTRREHPSSFWLGGAALLGPLALLVATRPPGLEYAWARYLLGALPFALVLVAHAFLFLLRRLPGGETGGLGLGALLGLLVFLGGPLCGRNAQGSFSNTYLALHELPAFDRPYRDSGFYRQLADDAGATRLVEVPPIPTRAVLLYRNLQQLHGKRVCLGWIGTDPLPRAIRGSTYLPLLELSARDADYVVLHRNLRREVGRYFRFVYDEVWPAQRVAADEGFMRRQEALYRQNLPEAEALEQLAEALRARWGTPAYEDEELLAWRLGG